MSRTVILGFFATSFSLIKDCWGLEYCGNYFFCQYGTYCCHDNLECCLMKSIWVLPYWQIITIAVTVLIFLFFLIFVCVRVYCCSNANRIKQIKRIRRHRKGRKVAAISNGHDLQPRSYRPNQRNNQDLGDNVHPFAPTEQKR